MIKESPVEIESRLRIYNLVYYFFHRPVAAVETKGMAEMPDKVPDTIPPLPDNLCGQEAQGSENKGGVIPNHKEGENNG